VEIISEVSQGVQPSLKELTFEKDIVETGRKIYKKAQIGMGAPVIFY
jgi:hypothetical protein